MPKKFDQDPKGRAIRLTEDRILAANLLTHDHRDRYQRPNSSCEDVEEQP